MEGVCHDDLVRDFHRILLSSEVRELNDEVARLFEDLDRTRPAAHAPHGHCSPPLDVLQTESSVQVVVDLPGVSADRVRVLLKNGVLVLVGEKPSPVHRRPRGRHVPPGRARLRPLRARRPHRRGRRRRRHARGPRRRRTADHRPEDPGTPRPGDPRRRHHLMNILFIGDVFGRPGRELVRRGLQPLVDRYAVDFVIANVENAAGGFGITREIGDAIAGYGVDVMTSGNHIWDKKEALDYVGAEPRLLRPSNYPAGAPGRGSVLARTDDGRGVGVINLMGRVFMAAIDDPFAGGAARRGHLRGPHARDRRGLPRRGDLRKAGDGVASRRQGDRGARHAHPRADGGRADPAEGDRLHHRRGDDRARRIRSSAPSPTPRSPASPPACPRASSPRPATRACTASSCRWTSPPAAPPRSFA